MTILPHNIAAGLLVGGITIGGYFAVNGLTPPELDAHLTSLGLEVLKDGWADKEKEYKEATGEELISSITKDTGKQTITDFETKLKNWCTKYKIKPFLGEDDANFKRFSRWCTKTAKIEAVLQKRGLKALTNDEKDAKFALYSAPENTEKFLEQTSTSAKTPAKVITVKELNDWCNEKQTKSDYKYESDPLLKQIIKWCYNA